MPDSPVARDLSPTNEPQDTAAPSAGSEQPGSPKAHRLPATRTGATFTGLLAGVVVLVLLLVFMLENTESVKISYFGATGHLALGVALLLAAVGGALLVGVVGAVRIVQLRRHARRRH